jgi:serine/threonine protein kinase
MSDETKTIEQYIENLAEKEDENLGKVIGNRYEVERVLGEGGMGRVYVAVQLSMSRKVALKVLHPQMLSDSRHVRRFYQEAKSASRLTSPHVVRMYDFGIDEDTGTPFIAMELLQGQPLDIMLEEMGTLPPVRAARILAQVGQALMEAHDLGIVHRDLKPENIFMQQTPDDDDFAKVMDFGIAKVLHSDTEEGDGVSLTATGMTVGTPLYMAPEQIQGGKIDGRTDVYSLGCILHELVMGEPPFVHTERLPLMLMHVQQAPPPLPEVLPAGHSLLVGFQELRNKMLAKDPDDRPASTGELVKALRKIAKSGAERASSAEPSLTPADGATFMGPALSGRLADAAPLPPLEPMSPPPEPTPGVLDPTPAVETPAPQVSASDSSVQSTEASLAAMHTEARKSFRGGLFAGIAVAFIALGVGVFMMLGKDSGDAQSAPRGQVDSTGVPSGTTTQQERNVAPAKLEAAKTAMVKVRILSKPAGASVMRGEKEEGKTPLVLTLPKGAEPVLFTLRYEGFADLQIRVLPDRDRADEHKLQAKPAAAKPAEKPRVVKPNPQMKPSVKPRKKAKQGRAKTKTRELDGLLD